MHSGVCVMGFSEIRHLSSLLILIFLHVVMGDELVNVNIVLIVCLARIEFKVEPKP